jgi:hypothetical protein
MNYQTGGHLTRTLALNKENIPPMLNHKPSRQENVQRVFGKEVHNLQKFSSHQMQIEELSTYAYRPQRPEPLRENPQTVPQFEGQILSFLKSKADKYSVDPEYMSLQKDVNVRMRSILVDWLVDVCIKFKLLPQTLFMTVNVIDRFLSKNPIQRSSLQLVGIASLMLVSKYEEIYPPLTKEYVAVCDNAYTKEEILSMETRVLMSLEFDLNQTSTYAFLQHFQLRLNMAPKALVFARYILEHALLDPLALKYSNLATAAGAVFLVNKIFKIDNWKANFEEVTLVPEPVAKACAKELYQVMQKVDTSNLTALKRKFASAELFEVSKYRVERVQSATAN